MIKKIIKKLLMPQKKWVILNYHQVSDVFDPKVHNKYIWNNLIVFKKEMTFLKDNYKIVSLKDGYEQFQNGGLKETLISITFDDGDKSIEEFVMPLLNELKIPATFFINTAYPSEKIGYWYNLGPYYNDEALISKASIIRNTENKEEYSKLLKLEDNYKPLNLDNPFYAEIDRLKNVDNPLFHFGLHGHEHMKFAMLNDRDQEYNLKRNIEVLSTFKNYVPFFAIPFGKPKDWNQTTLDLSKKYNVVPLLAYNGFNTKYNDVLLRTSVDGKDVKKTIGEFSPFINNYYKLNNLVQ